MKNYFFLLGLMMMLCHSSLSQNVIKPDSITMKAMAGLEWLDGEWTGEGWIDTPQERKHFTHLAKSYTRSKGSVLLIEGTSTYVDDSSAVHESFSVLSYDDTFKKFLLRAFKSDGKYIDAKVTVENGGTLVWSFQIGMNPEIRYTMKHVDDKWYEVGEFSFSGTKWTKFYEMTLSKK